LDNTRDVMPEPEIRYVPFGTRHTPPPASATDFKAALNAAVSFVTPSPAAPNDLTFTCPPLSEVGLLLAGPVPLVGPPPSSLPVCVPGLDALTPSASFAVCPPVAGVVDSRALSQYPLGNRKRSKTVAAPIINDRARRACPVDGDMNLETTSCPPL